VNAAESRPAASGTANRCCPSNLYACVKKARIFVTSAIIGFLQAMLLHHRAHGAVEDQDALGKQVAQFGAAVRLWAVAGGHVFLQFMTGAGAMLKDKEIRRLGSLVTPEKFQGR
jgi:hypothetical protein